ncbi:WD_REPEATS_REGION domain-containing protein [Caenorhabditis elegans]|uniref:WD_REPEATS_REGION domain-containing protein n=1 Tax=Caenorhabditis elegans TaxID=6239 RepID=Q8WQB4_CAEEL|nr:WD_REPEATS_REGION domain-containing protein [Caenorhabditis elegans]CAD21659.1 WD_REPEATS_REGION domain-containing protein [Caenorhabditis elegans]|eukprot:NP_740936.1 Telomerase CAjal Body protein 1 homolog [Caenorhabditis elegans]
MNTEESSSSQELEEKKPSLRAERCGIASLLSSLRSDHLASKIDELSTTEAAASEEIPEEIPENRPLNRKEKRKLQRMQEIDQEVKKKAQEPVEIAEIPTNLKNTFCDKATFNSYNAQFGYKSTENNNFVHFSIQNEQGNRALVASQDRFIRMYKIDETPEVIWKHNTGNLVLDSCWENSGKGVFSSSKLRPIQLFDTENGSILGAYNGKDAGDNITAAMSIGQSGSSLIGGFKNKFQIWDIEYTGDAIQHIKSFDNDYNTGTTGLPMSITPHPTMPDLFAAGGSSSLVAIYSLKWRNAVSTIEGSLKGYTNLHFSPDGLKLYASERKGDIHCFDTRMNMLTQILKRDMTATHRTRFSIDKSGRLLFSGTSGGDVIVYDLHEYSEELQPAHVQNVASRCVPCVDLKGKKLVLCSGERVYPDDKLLGDQDQEICMDHERSENSFQIFEIQN